MARHGRQDFAVIGLGRFGSSLARTLVERGSHVLGIDRDPELVQRMADQCTQTVALDSSDEGALRAVDIASFRVAIGTNFESNLLTTVALKSLGVRAVICKATTERQRDILLKVGADRVVLPEYEGGQRLAINLTSPGTLDPLPFGPGHSIAELRVPLSISGITLGDTDLGRSPGLSILAVRRGEKLTVAPTRDFLVTHDDRLLVLGSNPDMARLAERW